MSKEKLTSDVNNFIKETKDQDTFYIIKTNDEIFNKLRQKELSMLKEKFISLKENYLKEIKEKFADEFKLLDINYKNLSKKIINLENADFIFTNKIRGKVLEIEEMTNEFSVKHITVLLVGKRCWKINIV